MGIYLDKNTGVNASVIQRNTNSVYEIGALPAFTVIMFMDCSGWNGTGGSQFWGRYTSLTFGLRLTLNKSTSVLTAIMVRQDGTNWQALSSVAVTIPAGLFLVAAVANFPNFKVRLGNNYYTATPDAGGITSVKASAAGRLNHTAGTSEIDFVHQFEEFAIVDRALSNDELDMCASWQSIAPISRQGFRQHINMHDGAEGTVFAGAPADRILFYDEFNSNEQYWTANSSAATMYRHYFGRSMFRRHRA